jgi:hypothetical protein
LIYIPEKSDTKGMVEAELKAYVRSNTNEEESEEIESSVKAEGKVVLVTYSEFLEGLRSCSPVYFEILYTDFYVINPYYQTVWKEFLRERDKIIYQDKKLAVEQMLGHLKDLILSDYTFFFDEKVGNKKLALFYRFYHLANDYLHKVPYKQSLNIPNEEIKAFLRFLREEQPLELKECHELGGKVIEDYIKLMNSIEDNNIDFSAFDRVKTLLEEAANG